MTKTDKIHAVSTNTRTFTCHRMRAQYHNTKSWVKDLKLLKVSEMERLSSRPSPSQPTPQTESNR